MNSTLPYNFHPLANEQQNQIWLYSCENWGEAQADKYIDGLHDQLLKVSHDFSLLRDIPGKVIDGVKFFHYGNHYIFVRKASENCPEKIQVLSILHERMDIPSRLLDELPVYDRPPP